MKNIKTRDELHETIAGGVIVVSDDSIIKQIRKFIPKAKVRNDRAGSIEVNVQTADGTKHIMDFLKAVNAKQSNKKGHYDELWTLPDDAGEIRVYVSQAVGGHGTDLVITL